MSEDYGLIPTDVEVGIYALRTFKIYPRNQLGSIVQSVGHWHDGVCVARCTINHDPDHQPPAERCSCGIYAFFGVEELMSQYGDCARHIVAVIAAEGLTTIGTKGLKTAAARVVAYWCDTGERAAVCEKCCPGARRFYDRDVMARVYGLNGEPPGEGSGEG